jgi:hypothetical protein
MCLVRSMWFVSPGETMHHPFLMILAAIGATAILFALTFVSLVIGGLVNGMVALMSAPIIDRIVASREARARRA